MLASFVGVITPTLIVGSALGLGAYVPYLVSMALFVSGLGTFVQAKRIGPIGSGLLCLQGTSFGFLSAILSAGFIVKARAIATRFCRKALRELPCARISGIRDASREEIARGR